MVLGIPFKSKLFRIELEKYFVDVRSPALMLFYDTDMLIVQYTLSCYIFLLFILPVYSIRFNPYFVDFVGPFHPAR
jgi:hypothetical protein